MSSLETAVTILQCFTAATPDLAVSEVSKRVGVPKSTVSRVLRAMAANGLVEQHPGTRRYRVGLLPFRLGQLYQAHVKVLEMVEAETAGLVEATGFTGYVSVLNGADIVILRSRHGRYPVRMMLESGYRVAAFTTAVGKVLLARRSNAELLAMLPPVLTHDVTGLRKPISKFLAELDEVRARMWADSRQETFPGIGAIGAAVGSADEQQPVGFSLSFPVSAAPAMRHDEMIQLVVSAARRIAVKTADPVWQRHIERSAASGRGQRVPASRAV